MNFKKLFLFIFLITIFNFQNVFAENVYFNSNYFDTVLEGVSTVKKLKDKTFTKLENFWNFGNLKKVEIINQKEEKQSLAEYPEESEEESKLKNKEEKQKIEKEIKKEKEKTYLDAVLEKLGFVNSANSTTTKSIQDLVPQQPNSLNNLLGGNAGQNISGNNNSDGVPNYPGLPFGGGPAPIISGPRLDATPYTGPGGSIPGDCGLPRGPIANNIGSPNGSGVSCQAKTVMVGFKGNLNHLNSNFFVGGYFNAILESGMERNYPGLVMPSEQTSYYKEYMFKDYSSKEAQAYLDSQILHWRQQGIARQKIKPDQKCVPIDLDNCDSVGPQTTKMILDKIEESNKPEKNAGIIIKVFIKNPQLDKCSGVGGNMMSHPAVIGGFTEETNSEGIQRLIKMRKPEQILMFVAGTGKKYPTHPLNISLKKIENLKIPNSAYSYDSECEYCVIHECTYHP